MGHVVGNFARALVRAAALQVSWPLEIFSNADRPEAHKAERVGMFCGQASEAKLVKRWFPEQGDPGSTPAAAGDFSPGVNFKKCVRLC